MANFTNAEILAKELQDKPEAFIARQVNFPYCLLDALDHGDHQQLCRESKDCSDCLRVWLNSDSGIPNPWDDILIV